MIIANNKMATLTPYIDEYELQELIAEKPALITDEENSEELIFLKREVHLKATGKIDVLMMSPAGIITVVEVKLAKNAESRREVLAQIFDYVSTLSEYSYYDLDRVTDNRLSEEVSGLDNSAELPRIIENNLKSGTIRLIIAVDDANDNLRRLTRFLSNHTDFDLNLIEIKKYRNQGTDIYSSSSVIKSSEKSNKTEDSKEKFQPFFNMISEIWDKKHPDMPLYGSAANYRQILIDDNYKSIHYEFTYYDNGLQIRLDNELRYNSSLEKPVSQVIDQFNGLKIGEKAFNVRQYNKKRHTGRVLFTEIASNEIEQAVYIMEKLIKITKNEILNILKSNY